MYEVLKNHIKNVFYLIFHEKKLIKYRELPPKLQTILLRGFLKCPFKN